MPEDDRRRPAQISEIVHVTNEAAQIALQQMFHYQKYHVRDQRNIA